jgi:hypothetical protein
VMNLCQVLPRWGNRRRARVEMLEVPCSQPRRKWQRRSLGARGRRGVNHGCAPASDRGSGRESS